MENYSRFCDFYLIRRISHSQNRGVCAKHRPTLANPKKIIPSLREVALGRLRGNLFFDSCMVALLRSQMLWIASALRASQ
ncbi:hypothetical protein [Helicobacter sp. 23-1045]